MTVRRNAVRRSARAPLQQRSRKRWTAAACVAVCWAVLLVLTHSVFGATVVLAVLAGLSIAGVVFLKSMGVTRDHPWVRWTASRPWRDGQDVLRLALRHLPDVFVITPSGALIAPNAVDLWLNPDDLGSITERMELDLVNTSAAEVYEEQVAAHGARFAGPGLASVRVMADPSLPPGRYQLRQGQPVDAGREPAFAGAAAHHAGAARPAAAAGPHAVSARRREPGGGPYPGLVGHDGNTRAQPGHDPTADTGMLTVAELSRSPILTLRLVTDGKVTETRVSGARAGRGAVELRLPGVPTISREHARFTFSDGRWWIANLGRNGLTLNGSPLAGEQPLSNGDSIRWGSRSDSLLTWVEIG
jgi:hypothetical protein